MKHFAAIAFALIGYLVVVGVKSAPQAQADNQVVNEGDNSGSETNPNQPVFPAPTEEEKCVLQVTISLLQDDLDGRTSCNTLEGNLQNAKNCPNGEASATLVNDVSEAYDIFCVQKPAPTPEPTPQPPNSEQGSNDNSNSNNSN
ncbi:hypothetical protein DdX_06190 [Ditylenchus destructor]|uniref:Uncharacterized protein n=1 Tax=Ditylenchus destructor TaxID=166010 RepID=A0AAD4R9Q7_9BILA|nr:hypothetical protein DdX_06190 [Ditylenchus destructor]